MGNFTNKNGNNRDIGNQKMLASPHQLLSEAGQNKKEKQQD